MFKPPEKYLLNEKNIKSNLKSYANSIDLEAMVKQGNYFMLPLKGQARGAYYAARGGPVDGKWMVTAAVCTNDKRYLTFDEMAYVKSLFFDDLDPVYIFNPPGTPPGWMTMWLDPTVKLPGREDAFTIKVSFFKKLKSLFFNHK